MENLTHAAASPPVGGVLERLLDEVEAATPQSPPVSVSHAPVASAPLAETPSEASPAASAPPPSASPIPLASGPAAEASPQGGGGSPLASLLGNPAVLSALPALMENLSPLLSGLGQGVGSAHTATRPHTIDRHTALLCALKPYLSPHRRDTAETVIRLCKVWDALERSGISLTGLLGTMGGGGAAVQAVQERGDGHVQ